MRYWILMIPLILGAAEEQKESSKSSTTSSYVPISASSSRSVMVIDPKQRADDLIQAYQDLLKDRTSSRIYFRTAHGTTINGIVEAKPSTNGTMLIFKISTKQGLEYVFVFTEDIVEVGHS